MVSYRPTVMLTVAVSGFALNFWAWALLSPLAPSIREQLGLTAFEQAVVVAVPVLVGSLGRIPVGALTDRFGGRVMFPVISFCTVIPVLTLGALGLHSLPVIYIAGFFLGIGGTMFAVGIPFVSGWFPPEKRGLALGIFGSGMGGTAIAAVTTVQLTDEFAPSTPFYVTAAAVAAFGVLAWGVLRDAPGRSAPTESLSSRMGRALRLPVTWQAAAMYAVGFGGYVAFSVYLPAYLGNEYGLAQSDAGMKMAGFVVVAVLVRPIGGWLSDRIGAPPVLAVAFAVIAICSATQAGTPELHPVATTVFLIMSAALGASAGATFAFVAQRAPADQIGAVTGVVGAAGGLGGFIPPLEMGALYGVAGSYLFGFMALSCTAVAGVILAVSVRRRRVAVAA